MNYESSDKDIMAVAVWKAQFSQFKDSPKSLADVLTSGELPLADYMKWATTNFKIPFVNDNFFAQTNNFKLLITNPHNQWSAYFFPIHEWQGMLYVGCLEPQPLTLDKKHVQVLCSPHQLAQLWAKMAKPVAVAAPVVKPVAPQAPAAPTPLAVPVAPVAPVQKAPVAAPAAPTTTVAIPLGAPSVQKIQSGTAAPAPAPKLQEPIVVPTSHLKSQGVNVNPNFKEKNYDIPEITNVVRNNQAKANDSFTSTKTIMPFPDRTTQFTFIRTVYSDQVIIDAKAKINENSDPQDALISAFRILKDYYKKLMWVVRDQKGHAYPIACNTEWEFTEEAWNLPMDFKTPNPFRIAKLTQKPFHGPISKNRASDQFFKQWGDGTYPDVMSIVPVKLHGKVFGYFVGCGKGSHFQNGQSIELMESVCNELIEAFVRIHKELAKAAAS